MHVCRNIKSDYTIDIFHYNNSTLYSATLSHPKVYALDFSYHIKFIDYILYLSFWFFLVQFPPRSFTRRAMYCILLNLFDYTLYSRLLCDLIFYMFVTTFFWHFVLQHTSILCLHSVLRYRCNILNFDYTLWFGSSKLLVTLHISVLSLT